MAIRKSTFIAIILLLIASFSLPGIVAKAAHPYPDEDIILDTPMEVNEGQTFHFPGEGGTSGRHGAGHISMPGDLPDGTTLTVSNVKQTNTVPGEDGTDLTFCGDAFTFTVDTPDGTAYNEAFSLTLPFCNGANDRDIYSFNENTNEWEAQQASFNEHYLDLTVEIMDLHQHGVLSTDNYGTDSITLGEEIDIQAETLSIKGTNSTLIMPEDLPDGSTIKVEDASTADFVTGADELEVAGDVFTVTLKTPDGTSFDGEFIFQLHAEDADAVFYYNEETGEWEEQKGTMNEEGTLITFYPTHFSTYGAFAYVEDENHKNENENGTDDEEVKTDEANTDYVCYEDEAEMEIKMNFDEKTNVCPDQQIFIEDTYNYIKMPQDLPDNTTLTVTDIGESDIVKNAEGLQRNGDVMEFTLETPEGSSFDDDFYLKFPYGNGFTPDDIYFYNEDTEKWEKQNAELDGEDQSLHAIVPHLSAYGVFALATDEGENNNGDKKKTGTKDQTTNPKEDDETNGTKKDDQDATCSNEDMKINFDEETEVCADQLIEVADSLNFIQMPDDLPNGTTLKIADVGEADLVTNADGIHRAGDVLDFTLKTPENTEFTGNFSLKMPYGNGINADDIFFYHEDTEKWEEQDATFDYDDFTLNVDVSHLSTYGVFGFDEVADVEDEDAATEVIVEDGNDDITDDDEKGFASLLPETATNIYNWMLVGLALVVVGFTFIFIKRRKSNKEG